MVKDTNIPKINECLSRTSILSPGWRFIIVRDLVCTLSMSGTGLTEVSCSCGVSKSILMTESHASGFPVPVWEFWIWFESHATGFTVPVYRSYLCLPLLRVPRSVTFVWTCSNGFLRTGSDGFHRTCYETQPMTVRSETHQACRKSRIWPCWWPCHASQYQTHHRFWFGGSSFFTIFLLHPFRHRLRAAWRSENADVQQRERRWFHSSRVKFPLVRKSESWFWVSTYLIWILGSKLILSNNQSRATLWEMETCLIVWLLLLTILFITASLS